MKHALILLIIIAVTSPVQAKVDLVTLPSRDTVQLTIYNSADLTLVRESRGLTLKEGKNKLQFSWANTLIDPTSLEMFPKAADGEVEIADLSYPPRVRNLGLWNIESGVSGQVPVEITYLTSGLSWRAFYMGTLTENEETMRLQGYVRVTNRSGEDYENAQTRLIVGKVHIIDEIARLARREYPYGRPEGIIRWEERESRRRGREVRASMAAAEVSYDAYLAKRKEIVKEGLSEYFLYTIEGTETIPTGWSKRLLSFEADDVPVVNLYKYEEERYGNAVVRFLSFKNDKEHKLGETPIPGGMLKAYRGIDEDEHLAYVGQSAFKYIPVDEDVELNLGPVADVVVKPTLMDFRTENYRFDPNGNIAGWDEVQTFEVEAKNAREVPIKVEIQRNFNVKNWELQTKRKFEKVDMDTVKFALALEPRSVEKFQYVLRIPHHIKYWGQEYLVGWWKFDEMSGTTIKDSSGKGHDGVVVEGKPVWDSGGKLGGCLNFDETYGVSIPKDVFGSIDKAITISVWVNGDENQPNHENVILQTGTSAGGRAYVVTVKTEWKDDGRVEFIAGNEERDEVSYNAALEEWAGRWNHYVFVKNADEGFQRIYLNGRVVAEETDTTASMAGVETARIGIAPDRFGDQYIGKLDDIRIYDRALPAEQIKQLYLRGR
ncbi:MAG: LamG-like jellyroll fold domain-containing protein [Planctomycetota bacterium]|jgi:hypothetical protein